LRSKNLWASNPKYLVKTIAKNNQELAVQYEAAFEKLYLHNDATAVFELAKRILEPVGGTLFEGYSRQAPKDWRRSLAPADSKK